MPLRGTARKELMPYPFMGYSAESFNRTLHPQGVLLGCVKLHWEEKYLTILNIIFSVKEEG